MSWTFENHCDHNAQVAQTLNQRFDANETAHFTRALEFVKAQTYDVKYPTLMARQLIPVSNEVDNASDAILYRQWDHVGMAKIIANHADDLPLVDALAKEFSSPVKSLGVAFQYSIQDIRRSAKTGSALERHRADAARQAFENRVDDIAAFGDPSTNLPGFFRLANVPVLAATGVFTGLTHEQILDDLMRLTHSIPNATKGVERPDTLVLPVEILNYISSNKINPNTDKTILAAFLERNRYITSVEEWYKAGEADVAGTGPRAVAYRKDPTVLTLEIPQEFEMFPAQPHNLSFRVPCHGRIGGVQCRYPLALAYMDGI